MYEYDCWVKGKYVGRVWADATQQARYEAARLYCEQHYSRDLRMTEVLPYVSVRKVRNYVVW